MCYSWISVVKCEILKLPKVIFFPRVGFFFLTLTKSDRYTLQPLTVSVPSEGGQEILTPLINDRLNIAFQKAQHRWFSLHLKLKDYISRQCTHLHEICVCSVCPQAMVHDQDPLITDYLLSMRSSHCRMLYLSEM